MDVHHSLAVEQSYQVAGVAVLAPGSCLTSFQLRASLPV